MRASDAQLEWLPTTVDQLFQPPGLDPIAQFTRSLVNHRKLPDLVCLIPELPESPLPRFTGKRGDPNSSMIQLNGYYEA